MTIKGQEVEGKEGLKAFAVEKFTDFLEAVDANAAGVKEGSATAEDSRLMQLVVEGKYSESNGDTDGNRSPREHIVLMQEKFHDTLNEEAYATLEAFDQAEDE